MLIRRLEIKAVRNLRAASLSDLAQINVLYGANGAGKTSVLESIHLLSSARSFRSHKLKPLINHTADSCVAFAEVDIPGLGYQPVGVERFKSSNTSAAIKISGSTVKSASVLADTLPLQVICSDTFKLLEGSPSVRRQFIDWGVFHVEQDFLRAWKVAQRCLKQRNTLLRHDRIDDQQLAVWTAELARAGEEIDQYRKRYFEQFVPVFEKLLGRLSDIEGLKLAYYRGWDKDKTLAEAFEDNRARESEQGHTMSGPHRADLRFRVNGMSAADILSRGQQKLVICALRVAQGFLLSQLNQRSCVYLIDDLPAELDKNHRKALCVLLEELGCQVFVTCVDYQDMLDSWSPGTLIKMFHVEQGNISAVNC